LIAYISRNRSIVHIAAARYRALKSLFCQSSARSKVADRSESLLSASKGS